MHDLWVYGEISLRTRNSVTRVFLVKTSHPYLASSSTMQYHAERSGEKLSKHFIRRNVEF